MRAFRPATPYGEAAQGLGDAFVKGLMLAPQRERADAAAGFDRLRTEQLQGQMAAQQQMSDLFRTMAPGMSPDQVVRSLYSIAATAGPDLLRLAPDLARGAFAGVPGATPEQFTNLQLGAGQAWNTTVPGTREHEAAATNRAFGTARINNEGAMARQNALPMPAFDAATNQPRFTTQGQAATSGFQPILSNTEAQGTAFRQLPPEMQALASGPTPDQVRGTVMAQSLQPNFQATPAQQAILKPESRQRPERFNYLTPTGQSGMGTFDGMQFLDERGNPLPPGTTSVSQQVTGTSTESLRPNVISAAQEQLVAIDRFVPMVDRLIQITIDRPDVFGVTGNVQRAAQTAIDVLNNIGLMLPGETPRHAQQRLENEIARRLRPEDAGRWRGFGRELSEVEILTEMAAYAHASAANGQSGRSLALPELESSRRSMGDATSWRAGATSARTKLQVARDDMMRRRAQVEAVLKQNSPSAGQAAAPPPGNNRSGRVRVTSPEEAQRLAPGTEYETPDGEVYVR